MQEPAHNIYKALGNRERVRLLLCLKKEQTVNELLEKCHLSQSALSQHLSILKESNLVSCRRDGKNQYYQVLNKKILDLCTALQNLEQSN